jgi:hypothetical protein
MHVRILIRIGKDGEGEIDDVRDNKIEKECRIGKGNRKSRNDYLLMI